MKVGLVLSGGGGKGAYELGVWKAIKELGLDKYVTAVSGASIGAMNAMLFAQNDYEEALKMWEEVTIEKLLPINNKELIKKGVTLAIGSMTLEVVRKHMPKLLEQGDVPRDGAIEMISKYMNFDKLKSTGVNCYVSCTETTEFKAEYFKINDYDEETARDMILASSSLPMIYESAEVLGKKYLDGGLVDNTPIKPLYDEKCDIIIAVLLSKEAKIERELFPNAKIISIVPSIMENKVLEGLLNLDEEAKDKRIERGYEDTKNLLEPIFTLAIHQYKEKLEKEEAERRRIKEENRNWIAKAVVSLKDKVLQR
ncbi:MAG: patatin-like phospholipase family protein [Clostridium sp.]